MAKRRKITDPILIKMAGTDEVYSHRPMPPLFDEVLTTDTAIMVAPCAAKLTYQQYVMVVRLGLGSISDGLRRAVDLAIEQEKVLRMAEEFG